jgi:hypothetical protein
VAEDTTRGKGMLLNGTRCKPNTELFASSALRLHIRDVLGSTLGRYIDYPDRGFSCSLRSLQADESDSTSD